VTSNGRAGDLLFDLVAKLQVRLEDQTVLVVFRAEVDVVGLGKGAFEGCQQIMRHADLLAGGNYLFVQGACPAQSVYPEEESILEELAMDHLERALDCDPCIQAANVSKERHDQVDAALHPGCLPVSARG
jgi:hypothetical protein